MSGRQRYPRGSQVDSSPSPSPTAPLFPSPMPRTPPNPTHVATLEQAFLVHGPKYKLVLPEHRTSLCAGTGLGAGDLRTWWMTRYALDPNATAHRSARS